MERRSVGGYVFLGTAIRFLMERNEGNPVFGDGQICDNTEGLFRRLDQYDLHITARVLWKLRSLHDQWQSEQEEHSDDPDWITGRRLNSEEAEDLRSAARTGRDTLLAEAQGKVAYIVEDKRFTVEKLTEDVASLFAPGVFDRLPTIAQDDFVDAGRAIAFMLTTAGAFHILRATEAALRDYYTSFVRRGRIAEPRMWGPIVTHLRSKTSPPPELMTTSLDSLRRHFRNPTQHPEKTYDIDEVQDLLSSAVDVINQMYRHLGTLGR